MKITSSEFGPEQKTGQQVKCSVASCESAFRGLGDLVIREIGKVDDSIHKKP